MSTEPDDQPDAATVYYDRDRSLWFYLNPITLLVVHYNRDGLPQAYIYQIPSHTSKHCHLGGVHQGLTLDADETVLKLNFTGGHHD